MNPLRTNFQPGEAIRADYLNQTNGAINELMSRPSGSIIPITYEDLVSLRDDDSLMTGTWYRITDYECTVNSDQEEARAVSHPFDIIVKADDSHTLNENAFAAIHEDDDYFANCNLNAWQLKYCIDNDRNRFEWANDEGDGKGVIYWMKDEWNNECPYDFKGIQFKRYWIDSVEKGCIDSLEGTYFGIRNGRDYSIDDGDYIWCYTFCWHNNESDDSIEDLSVQQFSHTNDEGGYTNTYDNKIGIYRNDNQGNYGPIMLNNIVLLSNESYDSGWFYGCYSNKFGNGCYSITFGNDCWNLTFGNYCYNITFGNECYRITFGNDCYWITFGNGCCSITFGNSCSDITFGNSCNWITFGNSCSDITFGNNCYYITFGNYYRGCSAGEYVNNIQINCSTGSSNYLQYFHILNGTNNVTIPFVAGKKSSQYAGLNSSGTLKVWIPADNV